MYRIILDLLEHQPTMVEFGIKYAIEDLNIKITFDNLVVYISENQQSYADQIDIISKIIGLMVIVIGPEWLPVSIFNTVEELILTKKIASYKPIENLIMYIMDCDLDQPSPKNIDEMIKSTQCREGGSHSTFMKYIIANCNLYDQDGYLDYLENEKSAKLTQWFHPTAGYRQGDRLTPFILKQVQWITRIVILSEHTSCVEVWSRFFRMCNTLAVNNEKFKESMTFKVSIRQLMINYGSKFTTYTHLYLFYENMNRNVVSHLKLTDNIYNYEMFIFNPEKYRPILNELIKCRKQMVYFRALILSKSVKCDIKYMTIHILNMLYGPKFCSRKIQKHMKSLTHS
jgi:hypothetical protein